MAEYRTHFSLWAMMSAPLLIGSDLRDADDDTFEILANTDVIAIDQDRLGRQATVIADDGGRVVYSKGLANGDRAVALSNETGSTATMATTVDEIGLGGSSSYEWKDLWTKETGTITGAIGAMVPAHGTVVYRVSRTGSSTRYASEDATISQGVVESEHSGFSGQGYVNGDNVAGSSVEWTVEGPSTGSAEATIAFGYANGAAADRPMSVMLDGEPVADIGFPGTDAWTLWWDEPAVVDVGPGVHTMRVTAVGDGGGPNLDYVDVNLDNRASTARD